MFHPSRTLRRTFENRSYDWLEGMGTNRTNLLSLFSLNSVAKNFLWVIVGTMRNAISLAIVGGVVDSGMFLTLNRFWPIGLSFDWIIR